MTTLALVIKSFGKGLDILYYQTKKTTIRHLPELNILFVTRMAARVKNFGCCKMVSKIEYHPPLLLYQASSRHKKFKMLKSYVAFFCFVV